jgi:hypothetical protein
VQELRRGSVPRIFQAVVVLQLLEVQGEERQQVCASRDDRSCPLPSTK